MSQVVVLPDDLDTGSANQREDPEGGDEVHGLHSISGRQPQHLLRPENVGRLERVVRVDSVHRGATVVDGVGLASQLLEPLGPESEERLRQIPNDRDDPG